MFKLCAILLVCGMCLAQAFKCEIPCPANAECIGEGKCSCSYGYRNAISERDGFPYCQWQGTSTTRRSKVADASHILMRRKLETTTRRATNNKTPRDDDDLVDDNSELSGDYRYQKDQHVKSLQFEPQENLLMRKMYEGSTLKAEVETSTFNKKKENDTTFDTTTAVASTENQDSSNEETAEDTSSDGTYFTIVHKFYNALAFFCMFLAFIYIFAVLNDCAKL